MSTPTIPATLSGDNPEESDIGLVTLMACGDSDACAELYRRHARIMIAWFKKTYGHALTAPPENYVNLAFMRAFKGAEHFKLPAGVPAEKATAHIKAWLYKILKHVYIDHLRQIAQPKEVTEEGDEPKPEPVVITLSVDHESYQEPPEHSASTPKRRQLVDQFLSEQTPSDRDILVTTGIFFDVSKGEVDIPDDVRDGLCESLRLKKSSLTARRCLLMKNLKRYITENE